MKCITKIKNKIGRPTLLTKGVVKKLETSFKTGANITEACSYAGISRQVFYYNIENSEDFSYKMQDAVYSPKLKALKVIMRAIDNGDVKVSQWYLEKRYSKEFSTGINMNEFSEQVIKQESTITVMKEVMENIRKINKESSNSKYN